MIQFGSGMGEGHTNNYERSINIFETITSIRDKDFALYNEFNFFILRPGS